MNIFQCKSRPDGTEMIHQFLEGVILAEEGPEEFLKGVQEGFIAIGWGETKSLKGADVEAIRTALHEAYGYTGQRLSTNLGTVNCFVNTMNSGDLVLVPYGNQVHIGICGDYHFSDALQWHVRPVTWKATVYRDQLNGKVQAFVRNMTSVTKFKYPLHESELDDVLGIDFNWPTPQVGTATSQATQPSSDIVERALAVVEENLESDDPERQWAAAVEILRFFKN